MVRTTSEKGIAPQARKLIEIRAYSFFASTGVPVDELIDEGMLVYALCLTKWTPSLGTKFTTYLFEALNNGLANFCDAWWKQLPAALWDGEELPDWGTMPDTEEGLIFKELIASLSPEAQGVALILEQCADDLLKKMGDKVKDPHSPKHIKGALKRYLLDLGWHPKKIDRTFKELTAAFTP